MVYPLRILKYAGILRNTEGYRRTEETMATFQVKCTDEVAQEVSSLIDGFAERGGYATKGAALEALVPALQRATAADEDPEVAARVAEVDRMTATIKAAVTLLARQVSSARSEERAAVAEELSAAQALAEERAQETAASDARVRELSEALARAEAERDRAVAERDEAVKRLDAALALAAKAE